MALDLTTLDAKLLAFYRSSLTLYNREVQMVDSAGVRQASVRATGFLARHTFAFADGAILLAAQDCLMPATALLRTCLEAQARANHIVAAKDEEREQRATDYLQLMKLGRDYCVLRIAQTAKDFPVDAPGLSEEEQRQFQQIRSHFHRMDTTELPDVKDQYENLNREWSYGKVVGPRQFKDLNWQNRTPMQKMQPALHLQYLDCCAFVHADPTAHVLEKSITVLTVTYSTIACLVSALTSFFEAIGKSKDTELSGLVDALSRYPLNSKQLQARALNKG